MSFEEYENRIEYEVTENKIYCDHGDLEYYIDDENAIVNAISVYRTGEGIGRKLVELFENEALKENIKFAIVPASPTKEAISFWIKMNYRPSTEDDKYWAKEIINGWKESAWDTPQGVVVMEKNFTK